MFCVSTSYSQTYTITQLTNNDYSNVGPKINDHGHVVWSGRIDINGESSGEVFLYDGSTVIQLTNNNEYDEYPQINDNGHVVWIGWIDGLFINLYNGLTTKKIAECNIYVRPHVSSNGNVVWYDLDDKGHIEIFLSAFAEDHGLARG